MVMKSLYLQITEDKAMINAINQRMPEGFKYVPEKSILKLAHSRITGGKISKIRLPRKRSERDESIESYDQTYSDTLNLDYEEAYADLSKAAKKIFSRKEILSHISEKEKAEITCKAIQKLKKCKGKKDINTLNFCHEFNTDCIKLLTSNPTISNDIVESVSQSMNCRMVSMLKNYKHQPLSNPKKCNKMIGILNGVIEMEKKIEEYEKIV